MSDQVTPQQFPPRAPALSRLAAAFGWPGSGWSGQAAAAPLRHWADHFDALDRGAVLVDMVAGWLHLWAPNGRLLLATAAALPEDGRPRPGRLRVLRKLADPRWREGVAARIRASRELVLDPEAIRFHDGRLARPGAVMLGEAAMMTLFDAVRPGTPVRLL